MGKGDQKSRRGKIHIGSYGTRRPRKTGGFIRPTVAPKVTETIEKPAETAPKKAVEVAEKAAAVVEKVAEVKKAPRKTTKKAVEEKAPE